MDFVTIKSFNNPSALGVVQSYLEASGVRCFVKNEYGRYSQNGVPVALELQVLRDDVQNAIDLLIEGGFSTRKDFEYQPTILDKWVAKIIKLFSR